MEFLGGESGTMDAILTYPSPRHHDQVPGADLFLMGLLTADSSGHDPPRATINEGLSEIAIIEDETAVHRRDPTFIASMFHPFPNTFQDPPRM